MSKHFNNQRKLNRKIFLMQLLLAAAVAAVCFMLDKKVQGKAFALSALIFAMAQYVTANFVFADRVQAAPAWFGRLLFAVILKWFIVISLMVLLRQHLKDAPLMAILGVITSLVLIQVFNYLDARVDRGS